MRVPHVCAPIDANGNLTSDGATSYTWNAHDQLTALTGATTASFTYDAAGRRTSRSVGGVTTGYLYDGLDAVQEQIGGTPSANYLLGLAIDGRFARTERDGDELLHLRRPSVDRGARRPRGRRADHLHVRTVRRHHTGRRSSANPARPERLSRLGVGRCVFSGSV